MGRGKYSPVCPHANANHAFDRNCRGQVPPTYEPGVDTWDDQVHFADYDGHGFDRYGYSAFAADGTFAGHGGGVDRLGHTELEYLGMDDTAWYLVHDLIDASVLSRYSPGVILDAGAGMSIKETAKQRRERETAEAEAAAARWEVGRPMRLLVAMARARDLGAEAYVYIRHGDIIHYLFDLPDEGLLTDPVQELGEHLMGVIEARLDAMDQERQRMQRLARVRQEVIARLTPEELEALGLD